MTEFKIENGFFDVLDTEKINKVNVPEDKVLIIIKNLLGKRIGVCFGDGVTPLRDLAVIDAELDPVKLQQAVSELIYIVDGDIPDVEVPEITAPSEITFSTNETDDPIPALSFIGTISALGSEPMTLSLGGTHASLLKIEGTGVYAISEIKSADVDENLMFSVTASNSAGTVTSQEFSVTLKTEVSVLYPTFISLTNSSIDEGAAIDTEIGSLGTDGSPLGTLSIDTTFEDHIYFKIVGSKLLTAQVMPAENGTTPSLSVKILSSNEYNTGSPYGQVFNITIEDASSSAEISLEQYNEPMTFQEAKHFLLRATQGPNMENIRAFEGKTPLEAFNIIAKGWGAVQKNHKENDPMLGPRTHVRTSEWQYPYIKTDATGGKEQRQASYYIANAIMGNEISLDEQVVMFLREFLATKNSRSKLAGAVWWQDQLFRKYALGNWKVMLGKLPKDYAMQYNLNGGDNRASNADENYGREHLELYTIGKGDLIGEGDFTHYTEDDVKAASKVFTGWRYEPQLKEYDKTLKYKDPDTNLPTLKPVPFAAHEFQPGDVPKEYLHVTGLGRYTYDKQGNVVVTAESDSTGWISPEAERASKTFSEKFLYAPDDSPVPGRWVIQAPASELPLESDSEAVKFTKLQKCMELEIAMLNDMIFAQERTAEFLVERLYRWFINKKIDAPIRENIINPLANTLRANNYEIKPVLEQMLSSAHFFDKKKVDNVWTTVVDSRRIMGARVKSPLEYIFGYMRQLEAPTLDKWELDEKNMYAQIGTAQEDNGSFVQERFKAADYNAVYGDMIHGATMLKAGMEFCEPPEVAGHPAYWLGPSYDEMWNQGAQVNYQQALIKSATTSQGWKNNVTTYEVRPGALKLDASKKITNRDSFLDINNQIIQNDTNLIHDYEYDSEGNILMDINGDPIYAYNADGSKKWRLKSTRSSYFRVYPEDYILKEWERAKQRKTKSGASEIDYHPKSANNVLDNLLKLLYVHEITEARRNYFLCTLIGHKEYFNTGTNTINDQVAFDTAIASFHIDGWLKYYVYTFWYNLDPDEKIDYAYQHEKDKNMTQGEWSIYWDGLSYNQKLDYANLKVKNRPSATEAKGYVTRIEETLIALAQSAEYKFK